MNGAVLMQTHMINESTHNGRFKLSLFELIIMLKCIFTDKRQQIIYVTAKHITLKGAVCKVWPSF